MDSSNDEYKNYVFIIVLVNVISINLFAFAYPNDLWRLMKQLKESLFELLTEINSFMVIMSVQKSKKKMENRQRNQIINGNNANLHRPLLVRGLINANWANVQQISAEKAIANRNGNGEVDSKPGSKRQQKIKDEGNANNYKRRDL